MAISNRIDHSSVSIGKRYARNDELGTPLGITVDFDSAREGPITLRDRDSTKQVRESEAEIVDAVRGIVDGQATWVDISKQLPEFLGRSATES